MENISKKIVDELFEKVCQGDRVAFQELNRLSENGNARAMSALAKIYLKNLRGIKHSYKKAVELFEKAAALNEPYALYRLGEFYRDAKCGFKQDGNKAAEYFIRAAKTNIVNPSDNIRYWSLAAAIYHYGEGGVLPDGQKAIELYEKQDQIESQTDEGNDFITAKALFQIADIYIEGCGSVRPDGFKALEYLNKAIERGGEWANEAFYKIEKIYRKGKAGLPIDGYKVIECLEKRCAYGEIAEIYRDGNYNVKSDGYKAIEYLAKQAERDKVYMTFDEITKEYFQGDWDDGINQAEAYYYDLKIICNFRMPEKIAEIYLEGKGGVQPDGQRALEYLSQIAEGINKAIELTKNFIEKNEDVRNNYPVMLERFFFRSEVKLRNLYKQIAGIYHYGKCGVLPDGQKALAMYERLNEIELREDENQDHFETTALFKIFEIYAKGCGSVQIDEQRAVEYLFQAIERGYWSALFHWLIKLYDEEKIDIEVYGHKLIDYFLKYAQESCSQINDSLAFFPEQKIAKTFNTVAEIYSDLGDAPKALEYFLKADEYGDEQSHIEIARIYREGMGTLKPDGHKLIEFLTKKFTKSKENCAINSSILYEIAEIYEEGCGSIKPNIKKALKFYREAAELFETFAEERLVELTGEV